MLHAYTCFFTPLPNKLNGDFYLVVSRGHVWLCDFKGCCIFVLIFTFFGPKKVSFLSIFIKSEIKTQFSLKA